MPHRFGPFQLDEDARALLLGGVPQPVQPRVFDLLAYLVRHGGRVVPKDELMDALWPDLTVTEGSLQRAVSLARRALAPGGLENAIRSYVRHGYRFAIDEPGTGPIAPPEAPADDDIAEIRRLGSRREWDRAAERFEAIARTRALDADDLELWALSIECRGRPGDALPILAQAVVAHVEAGRPARAARTAVTLARIQAERGSPSVANGWIERAESLLEEEDDCAARAYLVWLKARSAAVGGRHEEAFALGAQAFDLAKRSGDDGLRALTLAFNGFYSLNLGRIEEGRERQNHAAAIALSSRVDPVTGGMIYCNILWTCRTFADWPRAAQWCDGFESWCAVAYTDTSGDCDLHRAEILGAQKTLGEALARIEIAIEKLIEEGTWPLWDSYRVRGDIHAMIGNAAAAKADYARARSSGWDAEPGHAVLLFESGQADAALAALNRSLEGSSWFHRQRRGLLLAHAARIAALAGRTELAASRLAELDADPDAWPEPTVQALAAEARAALCPPDDPEALRLRFLARQIWTGARIEYHAARVRLDIARALLAAGDEVGAQMEIAGAERSATRIGSRSLAEAAARLRGGHGARQGRPSLSVAAEPDRARRVSA